jgi:hypothetical protein
VGVVEGGQGKGLRVGFDRGRLEECQAVRNREPTRRTLTSSSCVPLLAARLSASAWCSRADPRSLRSESRSALRRVTGWVGMMFVNWVQRWTAQVTGWEVEGCWS